MRTLPTSYSLMTSSYSFMSSSYSFLISSYSWWYCHQMCTLPTWLWKHLLYKLRVCHTTEKVTNHLDDKCGLSSIILMDNVVKGEVNPFWHAGPSNSSEWVLFSGISHSMRNMPGLWENRPKSDNLNTKLDPGVWKLLSAVQNLVWKLLSAEHF